MSSNNINNNTENSTARRNSFSAFVKNLLLLVSPSNSSSDDQDSKLDLERKLSSTSTESSPFQDLYFSFPAFEEFEESPNNTTGTSSCGHQSYIVGSSRIMC